MKKIAAILLVLCLCFGLAACGNTDTNSEALLAPSSRFDVGRILDKILSLFSELGTDDPGIAAPAPETGKPGTDAPPVATPVPEEMTLEDFLEGKVGVWIFDSTVERYGEYGVSFALMVISETGCSTGYYPGEMDRHGLYQEFTEIGDRTYMINLLYEEGEYWGEYMPESYGAVTFRFNESDGLEVSFDGADYYAITYGGSSFEDAANVAFNMP